MTHPILPGRTEWETSQYLADHGHRVAAIEAYRYIAKRLAADPDYPLPTGSEAVIAHAAAAMAKVAAIHEAVADVVAAASKPEAGVAA